MSPNRRLGAVSRDRLRVMESRRYRLVRGISIDKPDCVHEWRRRRQAASANGFCGSLGAPGRFIVCKSPKAAPRSKTVDEPHNRGADRSAGLHLFQELSTLGQQLADALLLR